MPPKPAAPIKRCPVDGCKIKMIPANIRSCNVCKLIVCNEHQFPSDHHCVVAASKPTPAPQLVVENKKPAPATTGQLAVTRNVPASPSTTTPAATAAAAAVAPTTTPTSYVKKAEELPPIVSLKDENLETLTNDFVVACTRKKLKADVVVRALSHLAENTVVVHDILEPARLVFNRLANSPSKNEALTALESAIFDSAELPPPGVFLCMAMLMGRVQKNDAVLLESLDRLSQVCVQKLNAQVEANPETCGPWVGLIFSEALQFRQSDVAASNLSENAKLGQLLTKLSLKLSSKPSAAAFVMAGLFKGMSNRSQALADFKFVADVHTCNLTLLLAFALVLQRDLEPFCYRVSWLESLLVKYNKGEMDVRACALLAGRAICRLTIGPSTIEEWVSTLLAMSKDVNWRGKEFSFDLLQTLIQSPFLSPARVPAIVLSMAAGVVEAKKEVALKASLGLDTVGDSVTNPETKKLMPFILDAIKKPDAFTDRCLSELMDATFVNSLNSTSVSLIVPVITRALREGTADLKRRAAIATGNVCNLVRDVEDVRQFEAAISQELLKLKEHSSPEVRSAAEKAQNSLEKALSTETILPKSPRLRSKLTIAQDVVEELKEEGFLVESEVEFVKRTLNAMVRVLLVTPAGDLSLKRVETEVHRELGFLPTKSYLHCAKLVFHALRTARSLSFEQADEEFAKRKGGEEILVDIPDMILAYAGRVLLSRTRLTLKRGHRYGVVGKIGVGKTTLISRLAKGDLENFPQDVSTYMILHEVLQEDMGKTVHAYMGGNDLAKSTLFSVGFVDPNVLISTLSGGWRMRLAIAKSMLANADLIVMDEPTNHVDVAGVAWLANYLKQLEKTGVTCVIVSHDYDFLSDGVTTDILHINNQRLDPFEGGFEAFQAKFPEVAAALPKKNQEAAPASTGPSRTATPAGEASGEDIPSSGGGEGDAPPPPQSDVGSAMFDAMLSQSTSQEAMSDMFTSKGIPVIAFPDPGKLEGISSKGKPIMTATHVTFAYPANLQRKILQDVSCKLSLNSRVALRGANGQGKSTLLKLMVGELAMNEESSGELFKHHNLRVAYVSQHAIHHLGADFDITPIQYLQRRFYEGRDKERGEMVTLELTEEDKAVIAVRGEICGILSRVMRGKVLYYEIEVTGRRRVGEGDGGRMSRSSANASSNNSDFRSLPQLEAMKKPHVIKLVKMFDEEMKYEQSGLALRPVTQVEILKGLNEFGIDLDFAERKIRWLSGGQKARLVMAAAMWHRPHLICLDEPTNFLDAETLAVLTHSLRTFKGAVLAVSHHEAFVRVLCNEAWDMKDGKLTVTILKEKFKVGA